MESFSALHQVAIQVFESIAKTTSVFVLPLFMMKVIFSNITAEGQKVFSALKGVIIYFCLILGFPYILDVLFSIPESYLPKSDVLQDKYISVMAMSKASIIPYSLDRVLEVLLAGLYWVVYYLHVFFMIVMCSMAPIVFLSSTLLGFGLGLEVFMGLLVAGSSWPIIWFGFDQVHALLSGAQSDAFGAKCLELLLTVLKGIAPIAFAGLALKSPPGKAVTSALQTAATAGKWAHAKGAQSVFNMTKRLAPRLNDSNTNLGMFGGHVPQNRSSSAGDSDNRLKRAKKAFAHTDRKLATRKEDENENTRSRNS